MGELRLGWRTNLGGITRGRATTSSGSRWRVRGSLQCQGRRRGHLLATTTRPHQHLYTRRRLCTRTPSLLPAVSPSTTSPPSPPSPHRPHTFSTCRRITSQTPASISLSTRTTPHSTLRNASRTTSPAPTLPLFLLLPLSTSPLRAPPTTSSSRAIPRNLLPPPFSPISLLPARSPFRPSLSPPRIASSSKHFPLLSPSTLGENAALQSNRTAGTPKRAPAHVQTKRRRRAGRRPRRWSFKDDVVPATTISLASSFAPPSWDSTWPCSRRRLVSSAPRALRRYSRARGDWHIRRDRKSVV